ncbi:MAG: flotillin [Halioglobus sp.]|nr:flotillin [Halioglobus sp.]|tara:strand:+ start:4669 stop:6444 length:1776 start_codon:yes stop_codon:yes gene_type:complete
MIDSLFSIGSIAVVLFIALLTLGFIFARLYKRATKERAYVRTGFGGQKVIKDGGAFVLPVLHDIIWVNMNTLRLEVLRANEQALITKDRMRVDVTAEFYVRVKPDTDAIATAAQTLGERTMVPEDLKKLVEGKFVDALRSVAAGMTMEQLHESRSEFVQQVQTTGAEDLNKNGLELETVSLTGLDQTAKEYFNPDNAFDAEGLTKLTQEIEERRKKRNDIEQDTRIQIERKNLETEQQSLTIAQEEEFARLGQQREVENRRASQQAEIRLTAAEKRKEAESADILANREVELAEIAKSRATREGSIEADRSVREREIEKEKTIELANQDRDIAVAEKSKEQSRAKAEADKAKADAVREQENVITVKETAEAERDKSVELIKAAEAAEREAIAVRVRAEAEKSAAEDNAIAVETEARAAAESIRLKYDAEAEGTRLLNEAKNILSNEQISLAVKLAMIESLPAIIAESVKPAEQIESIKILDVNGINGIAGGENHAGNGSGGAANDIVAAMLKYQMMHPLAKNLIEELGLESALSDDGSSPLKSLLTGQSAPTEHGPETDQSTADKASESAQGFSTTAGDTNITYSGHNDEQ